MAESREFERWQNALMRAKGALQSMEELGRMSLEPAERVMYQEVANGYSRAVEKIEKRLRELNGGKR